MDAGAPLTASLITKLEARDELSADERAILTSSIGEPRIVEAGHDIVKDGERPKVSTLLVDGMCSRYKLLEGGERQITALHVPGDFVDLHSFLLKEMDHSVGALARCRVAVVRHEVLTEITRAHPHLLRMLWLSTLMDGAIHREWLVAMGRRPALGQTAHLICELYLRLKVVGAADGLSFKLPLTQEKLGDVLGLSSVHVNRVIQDLRGRNVITWVGPTITILDFEELQAIAEFDARYLHLRKEPR